MRLSYVAVADVEPWAVVEPIRVDSDLLVGEDGLSHCRLRALLAFTEQGKRELASRLETESSLVFRDSHCSLR